MGTDKFTERQVFLFSPKQFIAMVALKVADVDSLLVFLFKKNRGRVFVLWIQFVLECCKCDAHSRFRRKALKKKEAGSRCHFQLLCSTQF